MVYRPRMYLFLSNLLRLALSPMVLIFSFRACSACGKPMQGPFVRALGAVFHLNCFKCMVCHLMCLFIMFFFNPK